MQRYTILLHLAFKLRRRSWETVKSVEKTFEIQQAFTA